MVSFTAEQRFIVTGASSGIGEGVALLLNELGATVIGIGRNQERLDGMRAKAKYPENVFVEQKDLVEDIPELPTYVKSMKEKYGKFSGMAYCAGITLNKPLQLKDYDESRRLFDIDYFAPMFMAKGFGDRRNTIGNGTSMVFISSAAALRGERAMSDYAGVKAALSIAVRSIARELAPHGVRANCLMPSDIVTPMTNAVSDFIDQRRSDYPMGLGSVSDVATFVAFLLSNQSRWITGQSYVVDCCCKLL